MPSSPPPSLLGSTSDIFINLEVYSAFRVYLKQVLATDDIAINDLLGGFQEFLFVFTWAKYSNQIKEEIVLSFRETLGPVIDRYTHDDILGWISPFPCGSLGDLVGCCMSKLLTLEVATPKWNLTEYTADILRNVLWARIIKRISHSEEWNLAYRVKAELAAEADVTPRDLAEFIMARRRAGEELNSERKLKLVKQLSINFGFGLPKVMPKWV